MRKQELGTQIISLAPTLYRVSCSLLSRQADREDAVQSTIEKAWRKAMSLRDPDKLKPWMIRILINECHNLGRKSSREVLTVVLPEQEVTDGDELWALREATLALPEKERLPILLHYMEGFAIAEIAETLGCPQGTVLSRMDRGRKRLRKALSEDF